MTIDHDNRFKIFWEFFIGILATVVAIEFPLRIVLGYEIMEFHAYMNAIITLCFGLDIYLGFNTNTQLQGKWVTDKRIIAQKYYRKWFLIDLLAFIPFDWILCIWSSNPTSYALLRSIRMIK
ncbi:MAG TPA: hypothetical protein EYM84_07295, partial [Flavobacteriales bacterium]|nr:hypothetical protein [Flavobacteriales bacterium]